MLSFYAPSSQTLLINLKIKSIVNASDNNMYVRVHVEVSEEFGVRRCEVFVLADEHLFTTVFRYDLCNVINASL